MNSLANGTFHNFALLTHSLTDSLQDLAERTLYYEKAVKDLKCTSIKRGQGTQCTIDGKTGYSAPICMRDQKREFCGCEGAFDKNSCPYGRNNKTVCRSSGIIKCCYEKCEASLDLAILLDESGKNEY